MKLLLDECVDWRLLRDLSQYDVKPLSSSDGRRSRMALFSDLPLHSSTCSLQSTVTFPINRMPPTSGYQSSFFEDERLGFRIFVSSCPRFTMR